MNQGAHFKADSRSLDLEWILDILDQPTPSNVIKASTERMYLAMCVHVRTGIRLIVEIIQHGVKHPDDREDDLAMAGYVLDMLEPIVQTIMSLQAYEYLKERQN